MIGVLPRSGKLAELIERSKLLFAVGGELLQRAANNGQPAQFYELVGQVQVKMPREWSELSRWRGLSAGPLCGKAG